MNLKMFLSFIFFVIVIVLLGFYWIFPLNEINFTLKEKNYNFSLNSSAGESLQFYENMRFPKSNISYRIEDCPLNKKNDMQEAFVIIANKTILNFYPVSDDEKIYVTCDSETKVEGNLFIAGEAGPTNITKTSNFNVIKRGVITLIKESTCENPNVAEHELFHVLGFEHSANSNNIMYPVSKCSQQISSDMIDTISSLYSVQSLPDMSLSNVSAEMSGRYLNVDLSVINNGLQVSKSSTVKIYADDKLIKEFDVEEMEIGYGKKISLKNILVLQLSVNSIKFLLVYEQPELNKADNEAVLEIKK
jgi:hypothetical protein